ncbi:hypothetical protein CC1G_05215 [Coprinopsis cinerea okayama7|uniref:DUF7330 domain-containing protein n=1 Tax=Coprinopsis cinerea (strain Okayama-7 / 130 / ATCC MYA-4618 / FGSC 9003) TaxID=240176 RepID=A8PC69_COPC7|nr:hypothetical protein CC1G_05215 [Coprinopsis cinerea okayama7\|eukprot:XP_001840329.1 hypothetical protein CC1G_05215 [Coprinopsis cinerea okayama7\
MIINPDHDSKDGLEEFRKGSSDSQQASSDSESTVSSTSPTNASDILDPPPIDEPPPSYTPYPAPPQATRPGPNATTTTPPGPATHSYPKATNYLHISRKNTSLSGEWTIDPLLKIPLPMLPNLKSGETERRHFNLESWNGKIQADVYLAGANPAVARRPGNPKFAILNVSTCNASVAFNLHDHPSSTASTPRLPVKLNIKSINGRIELKIPRSFRGTVTATTCNASTRFSYAIQNNSGAGDRSLFHLREDRKTTTAFIGEYGEPAGSRIQEVVGDDDDTGTSTSAAGMDVDDDASTTISDVSTLKYSSDEGGEQNDEWTGDQVTLSTTNANILISFDDEAKWDGPGFMDTLKTATNTFTMNGFGVSYGYTMEPRYYGHGHASWGGSHCRSGSSKGKKKVSKKGSNDGNRCGGSSGSSSGGLFSRWFGL